MCDISRSHQHRFLVQFVDHVTFEVEVDADSETAALESARQLFRDSGTSQFTTVERDDTDWTACVVGNADSASLRTVTPMTAPSALAQVTARDPHTPILIDPAGLRVMAELLHELHETTLHKSSFERAARLIDALSKAVSGGLHA